MFLGSYKTYFNGKNRLILPKKIRNELGNQEGFYIVMGEDGEIWGLDKGNWDNLIAGVLEKPLSTAEGRAERRRFFSFADECFLDKQGRFILPGEFVEKSNLQEEVMIIGAGDHFEIWNNERWSQVKSILSRRT